MHNYGIPTETVRLALVIGLIVSLFFYERWNLTGGAAVVAGYLAIFLNRPLHIISTLFVSLITYYLVRTVITRKFFLYGRQRLIVSIICGLCLQLLISLVAFLGSNELPALVGLYGIGFVLPGLIAWDMERQGVQLTIIAVILTSTVAFLLLQGLLFIKTILPFDSLPTLIYFGGSPYSYHVQLLIPAIIISIIGGAVLYRWRSLRSGGFLTAAYLALFVLNPLHLVFIAVAGMLTYLFVTRVLMPYTLIFGRTKFIAMVLTAIIFTWALELVVINVSQNSFIPFVDFSVISPMIAALIANDSELQGPPRTFLTLLANTVIVFVCVKGIDLLLFSR